MRFGGHETFTIRPGWLSKGLRHVEAEPAAPFDALEVIDALGVGRNMGRSIWHWLQVTGLAERQREQIALTGLGRLIGERDPFLQHAASWWAIHVTLVTQPDAALAWSWFFGEFDRNRFDRLACVDELLRALQRRGERLPSVRTLSRDVACLLQSYASALPPEPDDPEVATDCPLRRLGLLVLHRDTGIYERRFEVRPVPPEILGMTLCRMRRDETGERIEVPFSDALILPGGPGRVLALDADGMSELIEGAEAVLGFARIRSALHGAERMIDVERLLPAAWLEAYYDRVGA